MRGHPAITSLAIVVGGASVAFLSGIAARQFLGLGPVGVSAAVAAAVTFAFAWRRIDGLQTFALVVLMADTVEHWASVDIRYVDEIALAGMFAAAGLGHRSQLARLRMTSREIALAVLAIAAVVSSLLEGVPLGIIVPGLGLLVKGFAFFYLVYAFQTHETDLERMAGVWLVIGAVVTLVGFAQFIGLTGLVDLLNLPPVAQPRGEIEVVNSFFVHPAVYGWLTAFISLFLYARFVIQRQWWAIGLAVLFNAATILSGRRTPLLGVIVGLAVGGLRQVTSSRGATRAWLAVAGVMVAVALLSVPFLGGFYASTLREYGESPRAMGAIFADEPDGEVVSELHPRVALYLGSVAVARDEFPFGAGLGRYGSHLSREQYSPVYERYGMDRVSGLALDRPIAITDTFWPMILGETGVIGLAAALAFVTILGVDLWRTAAYGGSPTIRMFTLGTLLVFAETLVRSLTSPVFVAPPIAYFALGSAALALAVHRQQSVGPQAGYPPGNDTTRTSDMPSTLAIASSTA